MALSVLGPVRLDGPTGPVIITGRKAREVLALLALAAPRPLSVHAIADRLWDDPPAAAVKTVQAHVSRIRAALAAAQGRCGTIAGGAGGYQLVADDDTLDVLAVDDLRRRARIAALAGDDHGAAHLLELARRQWRGDPELPHTTAGDAERARLAEEHLLLVEDHLGAVVASGPPGAAVPELETLATAHPLRERLWALRIEALYRSGRQADAVAAYRTVRAALVEELGADPGPELRALVTAVLHQTVATPDPVPRHPTATVHADVPRYAVAGDVHIAYGVYGRPGPARDVLLLNPTFVPVDAYLEEPHLAAAVTRLATGRRVIAFDRRGLGLSDPVPPSLDGWVTDAAAVLDTAAAGPVDVLANADTGLIALLLAATQPHRIASLTLVNAHARLTSAAGYPHGEPPTIDTVLRGIRTPGAPPPVDVLSWIAPSVAGDARFRAWWDAVGRRGASPGSAARCHQIFVESDVREVLPAVRVPVLVLSRSDCPSYDPAHGRYLAEHLPDARLIEMVDPNGPWFLGDVARLLAAFEAFARADAPRTDPVS